MTSSSGHPVAELIRGRRDEIVRAWEAAVREMPRASALDRPTLIDHIPDVLERIAHAAEALGRGRRPTPQDQAAERHAMLRLDQGFDLIEVVRELHVLRQSIFEMFADPSLGIVHVDELRVLDDAIDAAAADSVEQYTEVRERTLRGFERVTTAALESSSLDDLLRRLMHVLHEVTPAVDASAIYLRDGDVLRLRAAVGLGREVEDGLAIRLGEGFAGAVAARNDAMTLPYPTAGQLRSPILSRAHVRVVHGVPIADRGDVVGVATIASLTAEQFSLQDRRVFAAMAARASAAIVQYMLRDQARRATEQLVEHGRQFRALANNIPQLAWMCDAAGSRYWYNQRWYEYTGTTPEDVLGWGWQKVHHPDHLERVVEHWRRAVASGAPWEDTVPLRGRDGYYRWFLSRAVPIRDASGKIERWFGTDTDVTARRLLDDATRILSRTLNVREALEELANLAVPDLADGCMVDLVERDRLEHVAIAHADAAKREAARELARRMPPDPDRTRGAWQVLRSGKATLLGETSEQVLAASSQDPEHLRLLRDLGVKSWIAAPLVARGNALGVLHLIMGDSNRRYRESDLELAAELGQRAGIAVDNARLYREAQAAIRARDDVLAIVSHDLRSPLQAAAFSATMLLEQYGADARARKSIEVLRRSTDRMEHLINDLIDMASINAGKLAIKPARVDAAQLLGEILDMHEPGARERGITLQREDHIGDLTLYVDRHRLAQGLGNLLDNAIKSCAPGGVITVRCEHQDDSVRFIVADTGPGIPKSDLPHIFEPCWSGRSGDRKETKGTGLGLFITKAIVEAHAGRIAVEARDGAGATFVVTLPVATG